MRSAEQLKIGREIFVRSFFPIRAPQRLAQAMVASMADHDYPAGTTIFEPGSAPIRVFFIVEGQVQLADEAGGTVETFDEQSIVGIVDAVLDRPRARRAVCTKASHLLSLRFEDYLEILEDNFDFAKAALEYANRNIHTASQSLAPDVFKPPETTPAVGTEVLKQRPSNLLERLLVLHNAPFFRGAPVQPLVSLAAQSEEERWLSGQVLVEVGEPCTELRFVICGRVRADRTDPTIVGHFGPCDLLGANAALGYSLSPYRMTAEDDTLLLRVQKEDLYDLMEDHARLTRLGFAFVARENARTLPLRLRSTPAKSG